jgi:hypothetical protein
MEAERSAALELSRRNECRDNYLLSFCSLAAEAQNSIQHAVGVILKD